MEYRTQKEYVLNIAGLIRKLPVIKITDRLEIASFVMLGDTELNYCCAKELVKKFPNEDFDYIVVPEAKAIPLTQSICQLLSKDKFKDYIVLRKSVKSYMESPEVTEVNSITTSGIQNLVIDGRDARKISGKMVYLIDDVISTGGSYRAMVNLVKKTGANIKFAGVVLKEGDFDITDVEDRAGVKISFLERLPVFEMKK